MAASSNPGQPGKPAGYGFKLLVPALVLVILALFHPSLTSSQALFSNDSPLGLLAAHADLALSSLAGWWEDLYWLGGQQPGGLPTLGAFWFLLVGPVGYAKTVVPFSLAILALSAWLLFRELRFSPIACVLGSLGACLNMNAFSNACWGLASWVLARAMVFLALTAIVSAQRQRTYIKLALAGLAVGMCVMEGFDSGAIFSLYVAAFALFVATNERPQPILQRLVRGGGQVALIAVFAVLIAAQALTTLIGTQVKGIAGTQQDQKTKEERYGYATQWSLPKVETLRIIIPGLFGYRMDTPEGGQYWGSVGQQPGWEQHHQGYPRHTGSGEYAGVLVVLLALWAVAQSVRGRQSPYGPESRRMIWFWAGAAVVSLLFAFGRHAPFYRIIYTLPYFSTIRNPIKFLQPFHVATVILFAYGLQDLYRRYLESGSPASHSIGEQVKRWWAAAHPFDKKWTTGCVIALGTALLGWLIYAAQRGDLIRYLQTVGFDADQSAAIARFSLGEVGFFVLFLGLSVLFVTVILSGALAGRRANWAMLMLGLLLVVDLSRANQPWIKYYDYKEKYASNPVIDILRDKPYERRVAIVPAGVQQLQEFHVNVYHQLWLQHHFPYYNIQSLDIAQEPRVAQEKIDYVNGLGAAPVRYWQLTNTRLLFGVTRINTPQGPANFLDLLNQQLDPVKRRFRLHTAFDLVQAAPNRTISAQTNAAGQFALIEFTGALPRARLYSNWEVIQDGQATLKRLIDPDFDPDQKVLVPSDVPSPSQGSATNQNPGAVEFVDYSPKRIKLNVDAKQTSVLLLNDRYHPDWKVWVNGQPAFLLRCNYIMRGVRVEPGKSVVDFRFQPPITPLYVSLAALAFGLALCGYVVFARTPAPTTTSGPSPDAAPFKQNKRPSK